MISRLLSRRRHVGYLPTLVLALVLVVPALSQAKTLTCGLKTITLSGNAITKIVHEDGTVHTGPSVANNWTYDGTSITHRIIGDALACSSTVRTREEVITELSGRFTKNPRSFGMTPKEASLMQTYSANLMRQNNACHLLVDAAKSTSRKGMFFIDCNDKQAQTKRFWVSEADLAAGSLKKPAAPMSRPQALAQCNAELRARTFIPNTYVSASSPTRNQVIERTGRNVVEVDFEAVSALGNVTGYVGRCTFESGTPIEVTIREQ